MKKKILALVMSVVMIAIAVVGGTLAYLTDTDNATNTMVLGNVQIEQLEYERDANGDLVAFTQHKNLYPAINDADHIEWDRDNAVWFDQVGAPSGGQFPFNEPNAVDKFIFVKNTGHNAVYVRTLIAFERGSVDIDRFDEIVCISDYVSWNQVSATDTTIDGVNYVVYEYVYEGRADKGVHPYGVVPAGDVTQASLCQVYLDSTATNEDCANLDGNNNGEYDIIALSQAVQAEGWAADANRTAAQVALDTAFGDVNATLVTEWFEALN